MASFAESVNAALDKLGVACKPAECLPSAIVLKRLEIVERRLDAESDWGVKLFSSGDKVECEVQCDGALALLYLKLTARVVRGNVVLDLDRAVGVAEAGEVEWEFSASDLRWSAVNRLERFAEDHMTADVATALGQVDPIEEERRREAAARGIR